MRLALPSRAERLLERLPRPTPYSALELVLLSLLAIQCARLIWTFATPVGPVGDWQAPGALRSVAAASAPVGFDPFFRLAGPAGPAVVTSLDLKLFGVREDRATGRGSAIIGLPDGEQGSFAVGEEILPGVTLTAVDLESVTISRNGTLEQIFLDQSPPAARAGGESAPAPAASEPQTIAPPPAQDDPAAVLGQFRFQPRTNGGRVTGIVVHPAGSGEAFRAAGLAPGDAIVSINNQRITSIEQARGLLEGSGGEIAMVVDRSGRSVPLRVRLNQ